MPHQHLLKAPDGIAYTLFNVKTIPTCASPFPQKGGAPDTIMYAITPILHISHLGPYEPCKTSAAETGEQYQRKQQREKAARLESRRRAISGSDITEETPIED